ncbi:MAG: helix-turn-helix transcriptional regulator [Rhodospirillales bacterium]|nr:helix-turn-helix transcriptional regulator [Rhodospirillales bacterium]
MKTNAGKAQQAYLSALGTRVREARAKRGMSRRILAHDSGVSERYLALLESGGANPSITMLRKIAIAVGYPLAGLVAGHADGSLDFALTPELPDAAPWAQVSAFPGLFELVGAGAASRDRCRRISLIGLRGAGKSTLGRLLAERLGCPFIELNRIVEREYGGDIGEILALGGQAALRRYEHRCLSSVIKEHDNVVVATGGGLVSEPATFALLLEHTYTVWLKASPAEHMARVIEQGDMRPMAENEEAMDDLKAILAAREPSYRMGDAVVDTSGKTVAESLEALAVAVADFLLAAAE